MSWRPRSSAAVAVVARGAPGGVDSCRDHGLEFEVAVRERERRAVGSVGDLDVITMSSYRVDIVCGPTMTARLPAATIGRRAESPPIATKEDPYDTGGHEHTV